MSSDDDAGDGRTGSASRLGEILLLEGLVTPDDLAHALQLQASGSEWRLGRILVHQGAVDDLALTEAVAKQFRVPIVHPRREAPDREVVERLGREAAHQLQALPLRREDGRFVVAVSDPPTRSLRVAVERAIGGRVRLVLCPAGELTHALAYWYREDQEPVALDAPTTQENGRAGSNANGTTRHETRPASADDVRERRSHNGAASDDNGSSPKRERILRWLLMDALRRRASSVYLEIDDTSVRIRYRVQERLIPGPRLQRAVGMEAYRQVLEVGAPATGRPGVGNGTVHLDLFGQVISVPVMLISTSAKTHVALSLGTRGTGPRRLEDLAIREADVARLRAILHADEGLVSIAAPTSRAREQMCSTLLDEVARQRMVTVVRGPGGFSDSGAAEIVVAADPRDAIGGLAAAVQYDADVVIVDAGSDALTTRAAFDVADARLVVLLVAAANGADVVTRLADDVGAIRVAGSLEAVVFASEESNRVRADVNVLTNDVIAALMATVA